MEVTQESFKKFHYDEIVKFHDSNTQFTINELNDDCLSHIFMFLKIIDKIRIERVCRRWKDVSRRSWQNVKKLDCSLALWGFKWPYHDWIFTEEIQNIYIQNRKLNIQNIFENVLQRCGLFIRHIKSCDLYNKKMFYTVIQLCPNLQYLDVAYEHLTLTMLKFLIHSCYNLIEIKFGNSTKTCNDSKFSEFLLQKKQLRSFKISRNYYFTGECLVSLPENVDSIAIYYCPMVVLSNIVNALQQLKQLKKFAWCVSSKRLKQPKKMRVSSNNNQILEQKIHSLPTSLTTLVIPGCSIINMDCIVQINNLEKLVISNIDLVTDAFLGTLTANCKKLYHLDINGCSNVTDAGIQRVFQLPKLKYLSINYLFNITGYNFTYIPNLKTLKCRGCKNITDNGLCLLLETCEFFEELDLRDCVHITNTLVDCAVNVTRNRTNHLILRLYLRGTSVESTHSYRESPLLKMILSLDDLHSSKEDNK